MAKISIAGRCSKKIEVGLGSLFRKLYQLGLRANHISLIQLPMIVFMIWLAYQNRLWSVLSLVLVMVFLDILDGPFARATNTANRLGHMFDKVIDLLSIVTFAFAIGVLFPGVMNISIILITSTIILYIFNELAKVEMWGGSRAIVPIGVIVNLVYIALLISVFLTIATIIYDLYVIISKKKWQKE